MTMRFAGLKPHARSNSIKSRRVSDALALRSLVGEEEAVVREDFRSFQIADDLIAGKVLHPVEGPGLKTLYIFLNSFDKRICLREALFRLFR